MDAAADHIWQSTIFAAAAAALAWMCRNNAATVRHWIWFTAGAKFLVPFAALTAIANQAPLPQSPPAAGAVLEAAAIAIRASALPALPAATSVAIVAVWITGAFIVLARWITQWRRIIAHAHRCPPLVDGIVHDTVRQVERTEGIDRRVAIVASSHSIEPGIIGVWRPVLVWPQQLTAQLSPAHIEAIAAHEICHVLRRDNLLALVQTAATAAFWFHPAVWFISARLIVERERACDEHVLARGRRPAAYAESILKTCEACIASPLVNMAGITGGELKLRIARIMTYMPGRPLEAYKKVALLAATILTLLVPVLAGNVPRMAAAAAAQDKDREVERPGGGVTTPTVIREVRPQYTARAMQEKIQGEVLMECVVKTDGTVGDKKIIKSLDPDLDQAALDAAAQWLFEPGTRDGKPVNVLVTITMAFTLKP